MTDDEMLAAFLWGCPNDAGWQVVASKTASDQAVAVLETTQFGATISQSAAFARVGDEWMFNEGGGQLGGGLGTWYAAVRISPEVEFVVVQTGLVQRRLDVIDGWALDVGRCGDQDDIGLVAHSRGGELREGWPAWDDGPQAPSPNAEALGRISDAQMWVWGAMHQLQRFVTALRDGPPSRSGPPLSPGERRQRALLAVEGDLMLIAAAQARKALQPLQPELRFSPEVNKQVRLLRNIHEHYEKSRDEMNDPHAPGDRSAPQFRKLYPGEPAWSLGFGSDGHNLSVISAETLWRELTDLEVELARRRDGLLDGTCEAFVPDPMERPRSFPVVDGHDHQA